MDNKTINQALGAIPKTPSQGSKSSRPVVDFNIEAQIFRSCLLKVEPKFDIAKGDRRVLNSIFAWIWKKDNINVLGLDYDKGFYLYGPLGRGKMMTMLATRKYMNSVFARHRTASSKFCRASGGMACQA